jgi:hypothetical protein
MNTIVSIPKLLPAILGLAAFAACNHNATGTDTATPDFGSDASVTIMAFNVENLFDNADDPGKPRVPASRWTAGVSNASTGIGPTPSSTRSSGSSRA